MDANQQIPLITAEELSAILAHEIKNPMNSVIINVEVLKACISELAKGAESPVTERAWKYLNAIQAEVHRLDKVIKGFLDFANPSSSSKIKFKLYPLLQELVQLVQPDLKAKESLISLELQGESPLIYGNPDQIKQAILNLITNSLQSFDRGGTIKLLAGKNSGQSFITVADSGAGIPDAIQNKIFSPYFTTKAKGSGVGLFVVQRVVGEHGGKISIQSEVGKGSRFTLSFPGVEAEVGK